MINSIKDVNSIFYKKESINSYYDFDTVDDLYNYAANTASETYTHSVSLVRGILNKHVLDIIKQNKDILSLDLTNNNITGYASLLKKLSTQISNSQNSDLQEYLINKYNIKLVKSSSDNTNYLFETIADKFNSLNLNTTVEEKKLLKLDNLKSLLFFNILFNTNTGITDKVENNELLWGFKQKKYKRFQKFFFNQGVEYDSKTLDPIAQKKSEV